MAEINVIYVDMGLEQIVRGLNTLDKTKLRVGVVGPEASKPASSGSDVTVAEAALIVHMGTRTIPPRPFVEIDHRIAKEQAEKILKVVFGFGDTDAALNAAGEKFAEQIRDKILNPNSFAPNAESTIRKKGFDHPLIDTSELLGAIGHELVREGGDIVQGPAAGGEFEQFEVSGG